MKSLRIFNGSFQLKLIYFFLGLKSTPFKGGIMLMHPPTVFLNLSNILPYIWCHYHREKKNHMYMLNLRICHMFAWYFLNDQLLFLVQKVSEILIVTTTVKDYYRMQIQMPAQFNEIFLTCQKKNKKNRGGRLQKILSMACNNGKI